MHLYVPVSANWAFVIFRVALTYFASSVMLTWLLGTAAYDLSFCCFSHFSVEIEGSSAAHVTSPLFPCST